jgi:K+-sensing histidine kinase KdpD
MPDLEPLDLTTWLPAHFDALWSGHPRGYSISVVVPDGPTVIAVEPAAFGQAIDNVVDNAFKYGSLATPVVVTVAVRGGSVVLSVENLGTNIPEAGRGRVFEQPGRGLTVAAEIIGGFGGKIAALPHRDGARIAIVLPEYTAAIAFDT